MKLNDTQLSQVDAQIKRLVKTDSYYGKKYRELGITDVTSQEAFEELPFSSKDDLRNAYPLGIQAVPDEEVVRIHSSSGTTGKPVIIPYTAKDVDDWATMFARCYETAGVTKKDRVHITPGYGLWTAGIGFQAGAEKLGAMVIPMGPGNTDKQLHAGSGGGLRGADALRRHQHRHDQVPAGQLADEDRHGPHERGLPRRGGDVHHPRHVPRAGRARQARHPRAAGGDPERGQRGLRAGQRRL